jgi:5,5'-dehydrodivanillate O-demethylase
MLSAAKNEILTQVGAGTGMGELLRRYWHPVAAAAEVAEKEAMPVRLLGEDLVLFRSAAGTYGLLDRRCPHRGADLSYGWADQDGLRCAYHGWAFGPDGQCTAQAFEQAPPATGYRAKVRIRSYPTAELGGLVWGYLGPEPAPLLPDFEPYHWNRGFVEIILSVLPCNWFQCHENGVDPVHFEWLHTNWTSVRNSPRARRYGPRHTAVDFAEFEFGFICGRDVESGESMGVAPDVKTERLAEGGILCMWPYMLVGSTTMEWRVPIDETTTLSITRQYAPLPDDVPPLIQREIPYWYGPVTDERTGRFITSHPMNQDFAAWVGQGAIADRGREQLGRADKGIILLRRRYFEEIGKVQRGLDPPGTVRRPEANVSIQLPIRNKERYVRGVSREKLIRTASKNVKYGYTQDGFPSVQAGRPDAIRHLYEKAIGGPISELLH